MTVEKNSDVTILSDPLMSDYGSGRPSVLIAKEFSKHYKVTIITPTISPHLSEKLHRSGIEVVDLGINSHFNDQSIQYFEFWIREASLSLNSRKMQCKYAMLNFGNTLLAPSYAWYAQGPVLAALAIMNSSFPMKYRLGYFAMRDLLIEIENRFLKEIRSITDRVVANSNFTKAQYQRLGIKVDAVIPEPIDLDIFRPSTSNPSRDYVLSYLGKETDLLVLKKVAEGGLKLKLFGTKFPDITKTLTNAPNIEILGRVDDNELADFYSNALFTIFPFTREEFGYIPVESMACGTPVLTYGVQGPGETVLDNATGWLVNSPQKMVVKANELWHRKDFYHMATACQWRANGYAASKVAAQWMELLEKRD
jgi:glycosyltransferase involved in cell wall biosynthesis